MHGLLTASFSHFWAHTFTGGEAPPAEQEDLAIEDRAVLPGAAWDDAGAGAEDGAAGERVDIGADPANAGDKNLDERRR